MTLYLYRVGAGGTPVRIEHVAEYTADAVITDEGTVYAPLAEDCELSSQPDCSETLRAQWSAAHPTDAARIAELEELLALLLYGGENE